MCQESSIFLEHCEMPGILFFFSIHFLTMCHNKKYIYIYYPDIYINVKIKMSRKTFFICSSEQCLVLYIVKYCLLTKTF
jgi:hypothetical protein